MPFIPMFLFVTSLYSLLSSNAMLKSNALNPALTQDHHCHFTYIQCGFFDYYIKSKEKTFVLCIQKKVCDSGLLSRRAIFNNRFSSALGARLSSGGSLHLPSKFLPFILPNIDKLLEKTCNKFQLTFGI